MSMPLPQKHWELFMNIVKGLVRKRELVARDERKEECRVWDRE